MDHDEFDGERCTDILGQIASEAPKAAAKSKAKAKARAGKGPQLKICFVQDCDEPCVSGKRWCQRHNSAYDNLYYQAKKAGETSTLEASMRNPEVAKRAFDLFFEENPCDGKWRRKCLVNWSQWKRQFVNSQVKRQRKGTRPFEYTQWLLYCQSTMGWSKESAFSEWEKHSKDQSLTQDKKGLNGCDRIWIPVIEENHFDKDRVRSSIYQEGGNVEKNLGEEDRAVLLGHVKRNLKDDDHNEFFKGEWEEEADDTIRTPAKKRERDDTEKETPAEKKARIKYEKLTKNGPSFQAFKNTCSEKIKEKLGVVTTASTSVATKIGEGLVQLEAAQQKYPDDKVLFSFANCLKASREALGAWVTTGTTLPADEAARDVMVENLTVQLKQKIEAVGESVKLVKGDATLQPRLYFESQVLSVLDYDDAQRVVDNQAHVLKNMLPVADLFMKGILKIVTDIGNYIKQKEKNAERAEAKKKKEADQVEVGKVKEAAKTAAAKVRMFSKATHKIFAIKEDQWHAMHERPAAFFDVNKNLDMPWVLRKSETAKTWRNTADASEKLSEFGGSYRRVPSCKQENRAMAPVLSKQGKEAAELMVNSIFPVTKKLDLSSLKDGSNFENNMWYWGFDNKLSGGFLNPNAAAMLRVVAMGIVSMVAFDINKVVACMIAAQGGSKDDISLSSMVEFIMDSTEVLKDESGEIIGHAVTVDQDDIVYVPQGWFVAERVGISLLNYGIRKSFLVDTEAASVSYKAAVSLLKNDNRDTAKMEQIAALFSNEAPGENPDSPASVTDTDKNDKAAPPGAAEPKADEVKPTPAQAHQSDQATAATAAQSVQQQPVQQS